MKLENRAAFAIVLITMTNAFLTASFFEVFAGPWRAEFDFNLIAMISGIFSFMLGGLAAIIVLLFGSYLPHPRLLWLSVIGLVLGVTTTSFLFRMLWPQVSIIGGIVGVTSAFSWWLIVERFRPDSSEV